MADAMSDPASGRYDATHEMDRGVLPTGELPALVRDDVGVPPRHRRIRPLRFTIKALLLIVVMVFLGPPVLTGFRQAADTIGSVNPAMIVAGFVLQFISLACYSFLTRASLGSAGKKLSHARVFRIQLSTKALSNIVPGGNAAGSALGYRLLTLSGISGPDAGFALATAGIGSAVVLNIIFWLGLVVSIPIRGVNPLYGLAAVVGVIIMAVAAMLVIGLTDGQGRAEKAARWIARKLSLDEDRFAAVLRQVGERVEELVSDRQLLRVVVFWATLNWLFDMASLWMFLPRLRRHAQPRRPGRRVLPRQRDGGDPDPARWARRRGGHVHRGARQLRVAEARRRSRHRRLPVGPVPDADRARRARLRVAAGRSVEDREA